MGNFWTRFKLMVSPPKPIKVFMGGLDGAGKTTVLYTLKLGQTNFFTVPTVGFNVETLKLNDHVRITAWDCGGGCKIRQLFHHYWDNCKAVIWIIDSTDLYRMDQVKSQIQSTVNHQKLKDSIVLILANKQDIEGKMQPEQLIEKLELNKLTQQKRTWNIMKSVAIKGQGLKQAMDWLGSQLLKINRN